MSEPFAGIRNFRELLKRGDRPLGISASFNDPLITEALADSVDFFWYDLEHSKLDPSALSAHMLAARGRAKAAIVRVASTDPAVVKPVLDAGADGIVLAQVTSVDEVRRLVDGCLYLPDGHRGVGPRVPTNYDRADFSYFAEANRNIFTAVMLETADALAAVEEIVRVPRLDSVVIGPTDLSFSLGVAGRKQGPEVSAAIDRVAAAAHAAGVSVGSGMEADPAFATWLFEHGVDWIQYGCDFHHLIRSIDSGIAEIRHA